MTTPSFTDRIVMDLRGGGLRWFAAGVGRRLFPARASMKPAVLAVTNEQRGLEIGGPSGIFEAGGLVPVYAVARHIDNVNFSTQTRWEARLRDGGEFRFNEQKAPGTQWIREAADLTGIANSTYDFILSSHCLEHVANPIRALQDWCRVTRTDGHLLLILPDPFRTFDHLRPITTLAHLRDDFARNMGEDDVTHIPEVLALHDLNRDPGAGTRENFQERTRHNAENRCIHQHVFDLELMSDVLTESGWKVLKIERVRPCHLLALATKP